MNLTFPQLNLTGKVTEQRSIGPYSYEQPVIAAPITGAILYEYSKGIGSNDRPFAKLRIGYGRKVVDGKRTRHSFQVFAYGNMAIDALDNLDLYRGDILNLAVKAENYSGGKRAGHIVPAFEIMENGKSTGRYTQPYAAGVLLSVNGVPVIDRYDHVDLPASKFDDELPIEDEQAA